MKIKIAKTAGFCMGVRRAVDLAVDTSVEQDSTIWTLGPLIHNNQTIELLKERGIETIEDDSVISEDSTILVRAHGIPPDLQNKYESEKHTLIDGTCPKVKTVHKVIERYRNAGFQIVITGDDGHAEVIGLMGYASNAGHLIKSVDDVYKLPDFDKVCLVAQTTFNRLEFEDIAKAMKEKYKNTQVIIKKTICSATKQRQSETRDLAKSVDAMIVVGGKNSANTLRLADISKEYASNTQHVETEKEINWELIKNCETIGITAGASTPNWMIKRVADHIQHLSDTKHKTPKSIFWNFLDIITNLNIFVALGGVAIYFASCVLQGFPFTTNSGIIIFLYFFSMYLWNSLTNMNLVRHHGISKYQFYSRHKKILKWLAILCIGLIWFISWNQTLNMFYFMVLLTLAGSLYHFTIIPNFFVKLIKAKKIKDIPTSRDVFVALAWAVLTTITPHIITEDNSITPISIFFFIWVFILAFLRSLIFDMRDIEGDRIMGRETLVTIIGEKKVRATIKNVIYTMFIAILLFTAIRIIPLYGFYNVKTIALLLQIPVMLYMLGFTYFSQKKDFSRTSLFSILADIQFYISGIGCWIGLIVVN